MLTIYSPFLLHPYQTFKNQEPTKGKSIRRLFKRNGYKLFLIDEYRTSCRSFINGEEMEKFQKRRNPKPNKSNIKLCHGLLRSKNVSNNNSRVIMNRDFNGSMNILNKGLCEIANKEIPKWLKREKTESA